MIACHMAKYRTFEDQQLITLISSGDEEAFTILYNRYKDKLFNFALDLTNSPDKALDLVQDVFTKIWGQKHLLNNREIFGNYLFAMIRNFSIDQLRRSSKERLIIEKISIISNEEKSTPETVIFFKDLRNKLDEAIKRLPPRQREVFVMHRDKGLRYEEIAQNLNLSVSTVENHFGRALGNIRQYLLVNYPEMVLSGITIHLFFIF